MVRGQFSSGSIVRGAIIHGAIFLGGNCPRTMSEISENVCFYVMIGFTVKFLFQYNTLNMVLVYCMWIKTSWWNQSWHKNKHFTCFWYWCWKNLFSNVKMLKLLMNKFFQFHEHFFRSSRSQMFSKIGALKNFAVFWIKKRLQDRFFPVRSSHQEVFLKNSRPKKFASNYS